MRKLAARFRDSREVRVLLRGSALTFSMKLVGALSTLGVSVLLARYLGAEDAGVFYIAVSLAFLLGTISRWGMPALLMRETAAALGGGGQGFRESLRRMRALLLGGSIVAALVLFMTAGMVAKFYGHPALESLLTLWGLAIIGVGIAAAGGQVLRGAQMFAKSSFIAYASTKALHLLFLSLFAAGGARAMGLEPITAALVGLIAAIAMSAALATCWSMRALRAVPAQAWEGESPFRIGRLLSSGLSLMTNAVSSSALRWADTLILAAFVAAADVAIYNSAARIEAFVLFLAITMGTVSGPRLSGAYRRSHWPMLISTFRNATFLGAILVIPAAATLGSASPWVMRIFGPEFVAGADVLQVLLIGAVVSALVGPYGELLVAAGREYHVRNGALTALALGIALHLLLIPIYDALGAAIATTAAVSWQNLWNLACGWYAVGMAPPWLQVLAPRRWRVNLVGILAARHQSVQKAGGVAG